LGETSGDSIKRGGGSFAERHPDHQLFGTVPEEEQQPAATNPRIVL